MTQFYILEIQQYQNGEYGHIVHFAFDADPDIARLKGESKYHEILAAAAVSTLPSHAAILISAEGFPVLHQCYKHAVTPATEAPADDPAADEEEPTPADETPTDGTETGTEGAGDGE